MKFINKIICGDCLEVMDQLIANNVKVDAIITDPPFGTISNSWDVVIPIDKMWERLNKLIKKKGATVIFGTEPFCSKVRIANLDNYKYDWVWEKSGVGGYLLAKTRPLTNYENIMVFYQAPLHGNGGDDNGNYYPQGTKKTKKWVKTPRRITPCNRSISKKEVILQETTNYPKRILRFNKEPLSLHSSQKPLNLMDYLVKTYTKEGETVLDFTCGSGSTLVSCKRNKRQFIGIEQDSKFVDISKKRLNNITLNLF